MKAISVLMVLVAVATLSVVVGLCDLLSEGYDGAPIGQIEPLQIDNWGHFRSVNWLADTYFGGYEDGLLYNSSKGPDLMEGRQLSRVIYNSLGEMVLAPGESLELKEGYELVIISVDLDGDKVYLQLSRNGEIVDSAIVIPPEAKPGDETYHYAPQGSNGGGEIAVRFKNAFRGAEVDLATVDQIVQRSGGQPSEKILEISEDTLMTTGQSLILMEGYELEIAAIDLDGNRVYVQLSRNGEIVDSAVVIPPEAKLSDGTYIYDPDGVGESEQIAVRFKNTFRGAAADFATVDQIVQRSEGQPSEKISEITDEIVMPRVRPLKLKEGYALWLMDVDLDGNKASVILTKDGEIVDSAIVMPPEATPGDETYHYAPQGSNGGGEIAVRFKNAFRGVDVDLATVDQIVQRSGGQPSEKIFEISEDTLLTTGQSLILMEGYELEIAAIDLDGHKVHIRLKKDGKIVDDAIVIPLKSTVDGDTYFYSSDGSEGGGEIAVRFKNAFRGARVDLATVDAIVQRSEGRPSEKILEMSEDTLMTTGQSLILMEGYELEIAAIDLNGDKVYVQLSRNGEIVGSAIVIPPKSTIDGDTYFYSSEGSEGGGDIAVRFKNAFRGVEIDAATVDLVRYRPKDQPSEDIIEIWDDVVMTTGHPLPLMEGYELSIGSVDLGGKKVYLQLSKDGEVIDSGVVIPPEPKIGDGTYLYAADIGEAEDIVIIAVSFKNAFRGAVLDIATIDAVWQISESAVEIG